MASVVTTPGNILLKRIVPESLHDAVSVPLDKKASEAFFDRMAREHPDKYIDVLHNLMQEGNAAATDYGRWMSLSLDDLKLPPAVKAYRQQMLKDVDKIIQNPSLTPEKKNDMVIAYMKSKLDPVKEMLLNEASAAGNSLALSVKRGLRGNPTQLTQILFGDLLVADNNGKAIPVASLHGYAEGLRPFETWAGAYGSRKGYSGVQFATADTGYLAKQLSNIAAGKQVYEDDCGVDSGKLVKASSAEAAGHLLAAPAGGYPKDTPVTPDVRKVLGDTPVMIRTPSVCRLPEGICRKCVGLRENGKLPSKGEYIGITAVRYLSEPWTQNLALSAKHVGGSVGVNDSDAEGFEEINNFLQVPGTWRGAVIAENDGTVKSIRPAGQGGVDIEVGDQLYHVPNKDLVAVQKGQVLLAGDPLSKGTLNPALVARYRGIGEGRKYFTERFGEILQRNKVAGLPSNIDILSKSYVSNVRITDPDGAAGFSYGEIVPYEVVQSRWEKRPGTRIADVGKASGWLEHPILHHTIGTRITPAVIEDLKQAGIKSVEVNDKLPPFVPHVTRAAARTLEDHDWKSRLGGFYLSKAYQDIAARGASDRPFGQLSQAAKLMDPRRLETIDGTDV